MKQPNDVNELIDQVSHLGSAFLSIQHILLFGSQLHRRASTSDVDILIVLSDEEEKANLFQELCRLTLDYHILIHPVVLTTREFRIRKGSTLFEENIVSQSQNLFQRSPNSPNTPHHRR